MLEPSLDEYQIPMPHWHISLTVVSTSNGSYFVVRQLCGVLGVSQVGHMVQRMREDDLLAEYLEQYPVQTLGGRQKTWCIHKRAVAYWLAFINTSRVRPEFRPKIKDLKQQCLDFLDRAFWGEVESLTTLPVMAPSQELLHQFATQERDIESLKRMTLFLEDRLGDVEQRIQFPISDVDG